MLLPYKRQQCKINRMLHKYPDSIKAEILRIIRVTTWHVKGNKPFSIEPIQVTDINNLQSIYHSYSNSIRVGVKCVKLSIALKIHIFYSKIFNFAIVQKMLNMCKILSFHIGC